MLGLASHSSWKVLNSLKMSFSVVVLLRSSSVGGDSVGWSGVRDLGVGVLKSSVKGVPCGAMKTSLVVWMDVCGAGGLALVLAEGLFMTGMAGGVVFFLLVTLMVGEDWSSTSDSGL